MPDLRAAAVAVANDGRPGTSVLFTKRPDPQTPRPYGLIQLTGEPDAPLNGETEASLQLTWWGADWLVEDFAERVSWLDGHRVPSFGSMRGARYTRNSRVITPDPDLAGVFQMSDLLTCRYFSANRTPLEVAMS